MDIAAFVAVHEPTWKRLKQLTRKRRLSAAEIDTLLADYQASCTHLSQLMSQNPDAELSARLSLLINRARLRITGTRIGTLGAVKNFFLSEYPGAIWRVRYWVLGCTLASLLIASVTGYLVATGDGLRDALLTPGQQRQLVSRDFVGYYFASSNGDFMARVFTNNAWVSVQAVVFGVTGLYVLFVMSANAINVGVSGGVLAAYGQLDTFFTYILPHGLLELTSVFIACGAGLFLFWSWISPGPLGRMRSLASAARSMMTIALGLVPTLLVAGFLEGYVTPSALPAWARIAIGAAVWLLFIAYVVRFGPRAVARGVDGDLPPEVVGYEDEVAG
ncbi:stage II sporulation protein M [Dermabacteraceae bacterium P13101]